MFYISRRVQNPTGRIILRDIQQDINNRCHEQIAVMAYALLGSKFPAKRVVIILQSKLAKQT